MQGKSEAKAVLIFAELLPTLAAVTAPMNRLDSDATRVARCARVLPADCFRSGSRLFKEFEPGGLRCPREPDGYTVGTSTSTVGGFEASVKFDLVLTRSA